MTKVTEIIKIGAEWCQPCRAIQPILHSVTEELGVKLTTYDADEDTEMVQKYQVRNIPLLVFMSGIEEVGRHNGTISESKLIELIKGE